MRASCGEKPRLRSAASTAFGTAPLPAAATARGRTDRARHRLARSGGDADLMAHASDVEHYVVRRRASPGSTEVRDQRCRAPLNFLLLAWHTAMAIASRACSSSLPAGSCTCATSMRWICDLSALP